MPLNGERWRDKKSEGREGREDAHTGLRTICARREWKSSYLLTGITTYTEAFDALFFRLGSIVELLTVAELTTLPAAAGAAIVMVIVALPPASIAPSEQDVPLQDPCDGIADTIVATAGRA